MTKTKNHIKNYIILVYIVFWIMIAIVGALTYLSGNNNIVFNLASAVASWTPTVLLFIMFKQLLPGLTVKEFYKKAFSKKINISFFIILTVVLIFMIFGSIYLVAELNGLVFANMITASVPSILSLILFTVIQGATGEESGWRGFLQLTFEKKHSVIKSSLLIAFIWSFWHTPLWFVTGLTGIPLLLNILSFIAGNFCLSVIIGISYWYCRNLFIPIWIHFLTNFLMSLYSRNEVNLFIEARLILALTSFIVAMGFVGFYMIRIRKNKNKIMSEKSFSAHYLN